MPDSAPRTARAIGRAQLTAAITDEARRQLAVDGASGLSLRAVARALHMASSAVYRYFPSRDDLLTALIIDAYDALGAAAEQADAAAAAEGRSVGECFAAVALAIRSWALARPHEYALVFGSPVPGYRAPEATVGPASRVTLTLARLVQTAWLTAPSETERLGELLAPALEPARPDLERVGRQVLAELPLPTVLRALRAWVEIFGLVSFELFGHFHNVVEDNEAFFRAAVDDMWREVMEGHRR